jgi:DNA topoisomerase VI subunit B
MYVCTASKANLATNHNIAKEAIDAFMRTARGLPRALSNQQAEHAQV